MQDETLTETLSLTDEETPLPEGWRLVRLGDICRIVGGSTPSSGVPDFWNGEIVWITPTDLGKLKTPFIETSQRLITEEGYKSCAAEIIPSGSIIMSSRAPIGHLGIAAVSLCTNQGCKSFVVSKDIDSKFLYYVLKISVPQFQELGSGSTFAEISKGSLASFEIPLAPTIEEQRRIAAILDEQMKAVERARLAVEEQLKAARLLPNAFLRSVFESEDAQNWQKRKLGNFAKVQSGYAFKTDWYVKDGIRLLRNANVFQGFIDWTDVVNLSLDARPKFESYELNEGDIVLSLDRPLVSNGLKVSKLTSKDVPSLLLQRVGRFQLKDGLDTEFLYIFLNADKFINSIKGHDQSLGVPHISPTQVESIEIPVPPVEEQKKIAEKLNEQMQEVEKLKKTLTEQLAAIKKMPSALLRKAFAGEI